MVDTTYKSTDEVMTESQWLKKGVYRERHGNRHQGVEQQALYI